MQKNTNINFDDKPRKVRHSSSLANNLSKAGLPNKSRKSKYLLAGLTTFSLAFIVAYIASAEFMGIGNSDASTNVSANISSDGYYINVTSLGEVNLDIDATEDGATAYGTDTITVNTNTKGYKLYLSTNSSDANGNRMYLNGDSNSIYYLSPTGNNRAGIAYLGANSWGYTTDSNPTSGTYNPVPAKGNEKQIADKWNALTAGTDTTNTHTITYGAKADMALPAGNYKSTVTYSVMAEASSTTGTASVFPTTVDYAPSGTFTLSVTIPVLTNMDYGDWSIKVDYADCTNVTKSRNNNKLILTCTAPKNFLGTKIVTAYSEKFGTYRGNITYNGSIPIASGAKGIYTISNMQDMSSSICSANTTPSASATLFDLDGSHQGDSNYIPQRILNDTRDNKKYVVQKMPDGKCWMVQNLALGAQTLTSAKSNVNSDYNLTDVTTNSHTDGNTSSYGNYYSGSAASAGGATSDYVTSEVDICPKNWRLPNGEIYSKPSWVNEFIALRNNYANVSSFYAQWHPAYAGIYNTGMYGGSSKVGIEGTGSLERWWTRAHSHYSFNSVSATRSNFTSIGADDTSAMPYKISIRCIAK